MPASVCVFCDGNFQSIGFHCYFLHRIFELCSHSRVSCPLELYLVSAIPRHDNMILNISIPFDDGFSDAADHLFSLSSDLCMIDGLFEYNMCVRGSKPEFGVGMSMTITCCSDTCTVDYIIISYVSYHLDFGSRACESLARLLDDVLLDSPYKSAPRLIQEMEHEKEEDKHAQGRTSFASSRAPSRPRNISADARTVPRGRSLRAPSGPRPRGTSPYRSSRTNPRYPRTA